MRPHAALLACALLATPLPASAQRQRVNESWGKPGVSFLQYRTDAVECAYLVGQQAPVEYPLVDLVFFDNMPVSDDPLTNALSAADQQKAHFSRPWREITGQLQPALAQCLTGRGYRRIRLTKDQVRTLGTLSPGSKVRQVFLWNLAVSPDQQTMRR